MTDDEAPTQGNPRKFVFLVYGVALVLAAFGVLLLLWGYWMGWLALALAVVQAAGGFREQLKLRRTPAR